MTQDPSESLLARARLLIEQDRFHDAEGMVRNALSRNPKDGEALHLLAITLLNQDGRSSQALAAINEAIAADPENPIFFVTKAHVLIDLGKTQEALTLAKEAVAMDPDLDIAWTALASTHAVHSQWADMEKAARRALELDPDDATASNQLAHALRLQNKMEDNHEVIAGHLARDPENAYTHTNAGWAALQQGNNKQAELHFLEALRLDPTLDSARDGLINSFKARSFLYRKYLAYCFFMQRFTRGAQWGIILGAYFGIRLFRHVFTGSLAWVGAILGALYFIFVLWVHFAQGIGAFMLLMDRSARYALKQSEKMEGIAVGGAVMVGLILLVSGAFLQNTSLLFVGIGLIAAAIPFAHTFTNKAPAGRWFFGSLGAFALLASAIKAVDPIFHLMPPGLADSTFGLAILLVILSTWLSNVHALNR